MMPNLYKKVIDTANLADKLQEAKSEKPGVEAVQEACKILRDIEELES